MRRLSSLKPFQVALVVLVIACLFVAIRIHNDPDHTTGSFVLAGEKFVNAKEVSIPVVKGVGGDGQFAYRLAMNPFNYNYRAYGIRMDGELRYGRITLPFIAWLLSFGQHKFAADALLIVNVIAISLIGYLGAKIAENYDKPAIWGLAFAGFMGFALSLAADLHEIVAVCFVLAGVFALEKKKIWLAALFWSCAVLGRETALILPVSLGVSYAIDLSQKKKPGLKGLAPIVLPFVVFAVWQVWVYEHIHKFPIRGSVGGRTNWPFIDLYRAAHIWFRYLFDLNFDIGRIAIQFLLLVGIVVIAATQFKSSEVPRYVKIAFIICLCFTATLSSWIWFYIGEFRTLAELYMVSLLIVVGNKRTVRVFPWLVGAGALITYIPIARTY